MKTYCANSESTNEMDLQVIIMTVFTILYTINIDNTVNLDLMFLLLLTSFPPNTLNSALMGSITFIVYLLVQGHIVIYFF